jgi:hypothetical protein
MVRFLFLKGWFLLFILVCSQSYGQVRINELVSVANRSLIDEDGVAQDWIELFNTGADTVQLEGYGLSDDPQRPFKWVFPRYSMAPGEYLVVFASGKNRIPQSGDPLRGWHREVFTGIPGSEVQQLLDDPRFPSMPSSRSILRNVLEAPVDVGEEYGQRIYSWLSPPMTGNYTFWISGDDQSQLFLSQDSTPDLKTMIARVPEWTFFREWDFYSEQRSAPVFLEEGKKYYLECLMKEGWGGDHLSVQWQWPDGHMESPMSALHFQIDGTLPMHTNFGLSASGESVALTRPDGVTEDQIDFGPIDAEVSLGRIPDGVGPFLLTAIPTPGFSNGTEGFTRRAEAPVFGLPAGTYAEYPIVSFDVPDSSTTIYYTLDGSQPDAGSGIKYEVPFPLYISATVRSIATRSGELPSMVSAATYTLVEQDLREFTSNLPLMVIHQYDTIIGAYEKRIAYLTLTKTDTNQQYPLVQSDLFNSRIDIEVRGSSSQSFPKKGYGFHLLKEDGTNRKESLLGMPSEHNWVLHGPYSDKSLMRNALAYGLASDMGNYAPRTRFIELFLHSGNGPLATTEYLGVYLLVERIKIAEGRLDLQELEPHHNALPEISGGYIFKKDRLNAGESGFVLDRGNHYVYVRPQETEISPEQRSWLRNHLNEADRAIMGPAFRDPDQGYAAFINPSTFIDFHLMTELLKNIDGFRLSTFFHKDRNGKINLGPIWDYNLSWGNADYQDGWRTDSWYYNTIDQYEYLNGWFNQLFNDEVFLRQYKRRYSQLRSSVFSEDHIIGKLRAFEGMLEQPAARNFARWPVMGQYVWPNYYVAPSYGEEIDWMEEWIRQRLEWMDGQLLDTSTLIHYWNFNDENELLTPSYSIGGAEMTWEPGPTSLIQAGSGQNFSGLNARLGDTAGTHLRINEPIGSTVDFTLPTLRYKDPVFTYETRRSGSGANRQIISFTTDGQQYEAIDTLVVTEIPTLVQYDFTSREATHNQANFGIRIRVEHENDGSGGLQGNNRFDNVTLDGIRMPGANFPPLVLNTPELIEIIVGEDETCVLLSQWFSDPEGDALAFSGVMETGDLAAVRIGGDSMCITGIRSGGTYLRVLAVDPENPAVEVRVPVLVYPSAHEVSEAFYEFQAWNPDQPAGAFPANMLLVQSDRNDPGIDHPLRFAYHIPAEDYGDADQGNIGFPYRNSSRTRINGLGDQGLSFINTGRGRDLGAADLHINTNGLDSVFVSWKAATLTANSRVYHLRLQYRKGLAGAWEDFLDPEGNTVEYVRSVDNNQEEPFTNLLLPSRCGWAPIRVFALALLLHRSATGYECGCQRPPSAG